MSAEEPDLPVESDLLDLAWQRHVSEDRQPLHRLLGRYRERHRRYHTVAHLAAVVRAVTELAGSERPEDLDAVVAAAMYHDAVYEPASPSNERASARLARRDLASLGWSIERAEHVASMIEATDRHGVPPDIDHAVLFDADLSILGADADDYVGYADAVRDEYRHLDDLAWRSGRRSVLETFLARPAIYATGTGQRRWETAARANLTTELAALTD